MATPPTTYRPIASPNDDRIQPPAKRSRTMSSYSLGSSLGGSVSLLSDPSRESASNEPSLEDQCAHTTGENPVFRHGVDFENLCHWRKNGNMQCCELDMMNNVDKGFLDLAMYMYTVAPNLSIDVKLSGLLINMLNFYTEVYDPFNENPDKFDSQINLPFYSVETLAVATDLAIALDWQTRVIQKWSGKVTNIQVSDLNEILSTERILAVGHFITFMQCSLQTNLLTKSMSELTDVLWSGSSNIMINCYSKMSTVVGATGVGSANANIMSALDIVPFILAPLFEIDYERVYRYHEINFQDIDFMIVRPKLVEAARHMASQNLNARLELVGLVVPQNMIDAILGDVIALLPPLGFTKTRGGIRGPGVFFQIFVTGSSTICTSYPFYRI